MVSVHNYDIPADKPPEYSKYSVASSIGKTQQTLIDDSSNVKNNADKITTFPAILPPANLPHRNAPPLPQPIRRSPHSSASPTSTATISHSPSPTHEWRDLHSPQETTSFIAADDSKLPGRYRNNVKRFDKQQQQQQHEHQQQFSGLLMPDKVYDKSISPPATANEEQRCPHCSRRRRNAQWRCRRCMTIAQFVMIVAIFIVVIVLIGVAIYAAFAVQDAINQADYAIRNNAVANAAGKVKTFFNKLRPRQREPKVVNVDVNA